MSDHPKYVLVTPTRDEEAVIGETLASVTSQTCPPAEWVIVSDGSSDKTDEIIRRYQIDHPWITLVQLPPREGRCFGAVARATSIAVEKLGVKDYSFIGLLDSDLRFPPDYFEKVLAAFAANPALGLAGGRVLDPGDDGSRLPDNLLDVPGAAQFFRRECFESLPCIHAIPEGGWDMLTCTESRMAGFETALLTELEIDHLKPRNIAHGGELERRWQCGTRDYVLGYHPLFEMVKCARKLGQRPYIFAALSWWGGYLSAASGGRRPAVAGDTLAFIRKEQAGRLRRAFRIPVKN